MARPLHDCRGSETAFPRTWQVGSGDSGADPGIEVEFDPEAWCEGKDPQLEKAVEVALEALRKIHRPCGIDGIEMIFSPR